MSAIPVSQCASSNGWQAQFLSVLPAVQTHAQILFRRLRAERREEATQEAIASACVAFESLASRGTLSVATASTLATYAVKHVRSGRHVGSSQDAAGDVLSPVAQRRHGLMVTSYHNNSGTADWEQGTAAHRKVPIPDLAAFRLDFARWLRLLSGRDQRIVVALVSGETTNGVAQRFGLTAGRVSQLRRQYEHAWQAFQGESPTTAQAS